MRYLPITPSWAALAQIEGYEVQMGWTLPRVSSHGTPWPRWEDSPLAAAPTYG